MSRVKLERERIRLRGEIAEREARLGEVEKEIGKLDSIEHPAEANGGDGVPGPPLVGPEGFAPRSESTSGSVVPPAEAILDKKRSPSAWPSTHETSPGRLADPEG